MSPSKPLELRCTCVTRHVSDWHGRVGHVLDPAPDCDFHGENVKRVRDLSLIVKRDDTRGLTDLVVLPEIKGATGGNLAHEIEHAFYRARTAANPGQVYFPNDTIVARDFGYGGKWLRMQGKRDCIAAVIAEGLERFLSATYL